MHVIHAYLTLCITLYSSTPIMVGGIFAIKRSFYEKINGYDESLLLWGGENIDLSFKVYN